MIILTKLEVVPGTEEGGLELTKHGRRELESLSEIVGVEGLLHEEGLLAHHRHVLVQDAVLVVVHQHIACSFLIKY